MSGQTDADVDTLVGPCQQCMVEGNIDVKSDVSSTTEAETPDAENCSVSTEFVREENNVSDIQTNHDHQSQEKNTAADDVEKSVSVQEYDVLVQADFGHSVKNNSSFPDALNSQNDLVENENKDCINDTAVGVHNGGQSTRRVLRYGGECIYVPSEVEDTVSVEANNMVAFGSETTEEAKMLSYVSDSEDSDLENDHVQLAEIELECGDYLAAVSGRRSNGFSTEEMVRIVEGECANLSQVSKFPVDDRFYPYYGNNDDSVQNITVSGMERVVIGMAQPNNTIIGDDKDIATTESDLDDTLKEGSPENVDEESDMDENLIDPSGVSVYAPESEIVSFRIPDNKRISYPLCSSTPVGKSVHQPLHRDLNDIQQCVSDYPVLSTFKPPDCRRNSSKPESSSSRPLCSSTPVAKKNLGLRMRDINIMEDEDYKKKPDKDITTFSLGLSAIVEDTECCINKDNNPHWQQKENEQKSKEKKGKSKEVVLKRDRDSKREKKKIKGTRIQKFKEYMGPGLTSNPTATDESKENSNCIKNTDIETCTLTEYKGFGLTGPLPMKSVPTVPEKGLTLRDQNIPQSQLGLQNLKLIPDQGIDNGAPCNQINQQTSTKSLTTCVSGTNLGQRPAGTEGMLLSNYGKNLPESRNTIKSGSLQIVNPTSGMKKCVSGHVGATGSAQLCPSSQQLSKMYSLPCLSEQFRSAQPLPVLPLKSSNLAQFSSGISSALQPVLPLKSSNLAQFSSGTSSALQPDDVYPSLSSSKGDKSDSNTDKSGNSERQIDPKVLQCNGQLKLSAYMNFGLVTVHIIQARQLNTKWKSACDSFVKMTLVPDDGKKPKCKTAIIQDSNNPLFDEKFSFELNEEDHNKRLMVSVWHRDQDASVNEFLGCMSFGIRHLTNPKKEVSGWYYLLTEEIGRKKHLKVSHRNTIPQLKIRNHSNIPAVNKDVWGTDTLQLTLHRGKNGFGFSVVEACPVRVGRVDGASPAESAGLQQGDIIIRLNKQNVSRSTTNSVAKLVKHSSNTLLIEVQRPKPITYEVIGDSPDMAHDDQHYGDDMVTNDNEYTVPQMFTLLSDDKENMLPGDESLYPLHPSLASLATSTPLPLLARGHRTVQTQEMRKQEAIHRLLSLELEYIDVMHAGMQRYSRPLRHCILTHSQHTTVFQNIEKLTTISEYHVKQMHDNAPSSFVSEDTDTSASSDSHSFVRSIGLIYQSKVHMLCQAYDLYAQGIAGAHQVLSDLRCNEDFQRFIKETPITGNQPSITSFIYQPVDHVRELYRALQDVFLNTTRDAQDYNGLKEVVEGLQECVNNITNYSCVRVGSLSSLASRDSKVSFSGSMRSRSSTSSASSSNRGHGHCTGTSSSLHSSKSVDVEVMRVQDQLVFPSNVPVFQLCQDDRHIIFSGDLYHWEGRQWVKIHAFLFTDLILQTVREADGSLRVLQEPTMLRDITGMDAQRQHGTEFILFCNTSGACNTPVNNSGRSATRKLHLRAPSTEQKYAWKSLVEQRVFAVRGSLEYYSSCSDVSSSSASAVII